MANGNGDLQRLETELRGIPAEAKATAEFTLAQMGHYLAQIGQDKQRLTHEFAHELLAMTRRELAYLEQLVGKLK